MPTTRSLASRLGLGAAPALLLLAGVAASARQERESLIRYFVRVKRLLAAGSSGCCEG